MTPDPDPVSLFLKVFCLKMLTTFQLTRYSGLSSGQLSRWSFIDFYCTLTTFCFYFKIFELIKLKFELE